jgi:uncharacterized protein with HEPN domain
MQPSPEFDLLFLLRILEAGEKITLYSHGYDDALVFFDANDQKEFNACLNLLGQIGELANKVSDQTKKLGTDLPWEKLYGLRNRLVHDYTGIDKFITFDVIRQAIPEMIVYISLLIQTCIRNQYFLREDLEIAQTSPYLKHVNFEAI